MRTAPSSRNALRMESCIGAFSFARANSRAPAGHEGSAAPTNGDPVTRERMGAYPAPMNGRPLTGRLRRASDELPMPSAYFKFVLEQLGTTRALREAILEGTGVDPANVASIGEEITLGQQLRQNRNVNAVAPPGWALALGARLGSATHGVLGFGAVSAPTLRDTLELLVRYGHVRDPSFGFHLRTVGRKVRIEIRERIDLLEEERVPLIETFLLSLQALIESILGHKLEGTKVEVSARPAHADLYRHYFPGTVSFGTKVSALVVPES